MSYIWVVPTVFTSDKSWPARAKKLIQVFEPQGLKTKKNIDAPLDVHQCSPGRLSSHITVSNPAS